MSGLSDLLQHLNTEGWSSRRIERETEKHGHKISFATASRYLSGTHPNNPDGKTLQVLADIFDADINDLRAALGKPGVGEPFDLGPEASRLSGPQREAVRHVVRVMLSESPPHQAPVEDRTVPNGATTPREVEIPEMPDPYTLAAKRGVNRGRALRRQQDEDAEASQDPGD